MEWGEKEEWVMRLRRGRYMLAVIEGAGEHAAGVELYTGLHRRVSQVTGVSQVSGVR